MTTQPELPLQMPVRVRLRQWFASMPGSVLAMAEHAALRELLPDLFGYHIVQLGRLVNRDLMDASRISHKAVFDVEPQGFAALAGVNRERRSAVSLASALPIAADSVDVVILPHLLEFEDDPHQVLREVERVLIGEGHAIIVGFNPWSLWGLWRVFLAWRGEPPWCGRFVTAARVRDWLNVLGFDIVHTRMVHFRPPLASASANRRMAFLDKLCAHLCPFVGAAYVVVAKKRLIPLTPVHNRWRARRRLIASGIAEPTARVGAGG